METRIAYETRGWRSSTSKGERIGREREKKKRKARVYNKFKSGMNIRDESRGRDKSFIQGKTTEVIDRGRAEPRPAIWGVAPYCNVFTFSVLKKNHLNTPEDYLQPGRGEERGEGPWEHRLKNVEGGAVTRLLHRDRAQGRRKTPIEAERKPQGPPKREKILTPQVMLGKNLLKMGRGKPPLHAIGKNHKHDPFPTEVAGPYDRGDPIMGRKGRSVRTRRELFRTPRKEKGKKERLTRSRVAGKPYARRRTIILQGDFKRGGVISDRTKKK